MTTIRYELHRLIDLLDEDDATNLLGIIKKLVKQDDDDTTLTPYELRRMYEGELQIDQGEYMSLKQYRVKRQL